MAVTAFARLNILVNDAGGAAAVRPFGPLPVASPAVQGASPACRRVQRDVDESLTHARHDEIDESPQLQRQPVLRVVDEMNWTRFRLEGFEDQGQSSCPNVIGDLVGHRADEAGSGEGCIDGRVDRIQAEPRTKRRGDLRSCGFEDP